MGEGGALEPGGRVHGPPEGGTGGGQQDGGRAVTEPAGAGEEGEPGRGDERKERVAPGGDGRDHPGGGGGSAAGAARVAGLGVGPVAAGVLPGREDPGLCVNDPLASLVVAVGEKSGETRADVVRSGERADRQEWLRSDYEDYREEQERRAPHGRGYMFDGLVVAGWLCWHEERPVLAGVEPVSVEVAEWVYRLDGRSMVGPGRLTSGPRGEEDGKLEVVFPASRTPRDAFGTGMGQTLGS